ncbi:hypothetical protein EDC56_2148 [Sinobacterium caligoides]|uniref:Uncharacterized protein n=1 Tax=Sinobacterium caligoides TaxID=933926 RepID=A0A3N2DPH8_9GAMM|nr:hypothetical protein EDC56_2148 [Sinobacterium caligoides]
MTGKLTQPPEAADYSAIACQSYGKKLVDTALLSDAVALFGGKDLYVDVPVSNSLIKANIKRRYLGGKTLTSQLCWDGY